ncbi:MAG: polymer-forming cytoskeletal protein [Chitinispirillaceae bacterium]|nr:polymer-forming cytoskeletal protein [Chitinispirillaceae bacterium]
MDKKAEKGFNTLIGEGASFEGTVTVPHGIRIDGVFKGKIEASEMLTIGNAGVVEADIKAKSIVIGGKVSGNILAAERIELESRASFIGDLQTKDLVVNEGALFHGKSQMKENSDQ